MKPRDLDRCTAVLKKLIQLPVSQPFLRPVSDEEFPKYRTLIPNPMDLSTIRKRLKRNQYKTVTDFERDIEQISKNASRANGASHPVAACGRQMLARYRKLKRQYLATTTIDQLTEEYCALCLRMDTILAAHPPGPHLDSFAASREVPPLRSKAELLEALSRMKSRDQQLQLLFLIRELEPRREFEGTNEILVNLGDLKPETIAKLNDFVSEQLK
jgi:hypothetical protein